MVDGDKISRFFLEGQGPFISDIPSSLVPESIAISPCDLGQRRVESQTCDNPSILKDWVVVSRPGMTSMYVKLMKIHYPKRVDYITEVTSSSCHRLRR